MRAHADWVRADAPVSEVAKMMQKDDIGAVPAGRDDRLIRLITDRGIALRVVAEGRAPAKTTAEQKTIRRRPVLDDAKRRVAMPSLGDIAHSVGRDLSGELPRAVADRHR